MSIAFNIPAGYKLVPLEPTEAMIAAYWACIEQHTSGGTLLSKAADRYKALLAAAPTPPVDAVPGEPVAQDVALWQLVYGAMLGTDKTPKSVDDFEAAAKRVAEMIERRRLAASVAVPGEPVAVSRHEINTHANNLRAYIDSLKGDAFQGAIHSLGALREIIEGLLAVAAAAPFAASVASRAGSEPVARDDYFWLVELFHRGEKGNSLGKYHTGFTDLSHRSRSTENVHDAKRYSTKDAAEKVASDMNNHGHLAVLEWRAVEHGFMAAAPIAPAAAAEPLKPMPLPEGPGPAIAYANGWNACLEAKAAAAEPSESWTRVDWMATAERVYAACGDDEKTAQDCARWIADQQDWLGEEIDDPFETALTDIEGRPADRERAASLVAGEEIDEVSSAPWQLLEMARRVSAAYRNDTLTIQEIHYLETMIERAEKLPTAARDVLAERRRQVSAEGWTQAHDDEHDGGELAGAAAAYAAHASDALHPLSQGDAFRDGTIPDGWCWEPAAWKPGAPRRNLVKAGALIFAEIERIDRASAGEAQS